eukprot:jgi/Botrbrau1/17270/Bobra.0015s0028.1
MRTHLNSSVSWQLPCRRSVRHFLSCVLVVYDQEVWLRTGLCIDPGRHAFNSPVISTAFCKLVANCCFQHWIMAPDVLSKQYRFILVSDLDWTMVDHDDPANASLNAFNELWRSKFAHECLLVFSTGRSHALYSDLRKEVPLGNPDVLVCSVGTEIFFEHEGADAEPDRKWFEALDVGWDRDAALAAAAAFPELRLQAPTEQRPHKISYHLDVEGLKGGKAEDLIASLEQKLKEAGVSAKVIYSGKVDVDILPAGASKGKGLEFLLAEIRAARGEPREGVMVCGDSGNDIELFAVPGVRGCMVSNAHSELKHWCDQHASPTFSRPANGQRGALLKLCTTSILCPHRGKSH